MDGFCKELWRNLHITGGSDNWLYAEMHWEHALLLNPRVVSELERELNVRLDIELVGGSPPSATIH